MRISDWSSDVCSSDLRSRLAALLDDGQEGLDVVQPIEFILPRCGRHSRECSRLSRSRGRTNLRMFAERAARSEEHTSELQSLMRISYAVFCLKKKKYNT